MKYLLKMIILVVNNSLCWGCPKHNSTLASIYDISWDIFIKNSRNIDLIKSKMQIFSEQVCVIIVEQSVNS